MTITALQWRAAAWAAGLEPEDASAGTAIAIAPTTAEAAMTGRGERRMGRNLSIGNEQRSKHATGVDGAVTQPMRSGVRAGSPARADAAGTSSESESAGRLRSSRTM
jgi:hypothetical protein